MVSVMAWNIERFGAFSSLKTGADGKSILGTLEAISIIVQGYGADVLVIQEFRKNGRVHLPALAAFLENKTGVAWSFDYLPGAFKAWTALTDVKSIENLEYTGRANSEGYAVLWKDGSLTAIGATSPKMSVGRNGDPSAHGYINLILRGANAAWKYDSVPPFRASSGDYEGPAGFPLPACIRVQNDNQNKFINFTILQFGNARRPCWIRVNTTKNAIVPVVVYHAPVSRPSCLYGAYACALTKAVGSDTTKHVVLAGDFNLTTESDFKKLYDGEDLKNGTADTSGGSQYGYSRSQIQYQQVGVNPAALVDNNSIYEHPRDLLFYRDTLDIASSGVANVVADLQNDSKAMTNAIINAGYVKAAFKAAIDATDDDYRLPAVVRQNNNLMAALQAPFQSTAPQKAFASTLAAATFYRCFISDHLPVGITLN
jgi:hypothetical protein